MNTKLKTHLIHQRSLLALLVLVIIVAVLNPKFITPDNPRSMPSSPSA